MHCVMFCGWVCLPLRGYADQPEIVDLKWIEPASDPVTVLTERPRECSDPSDDAQLSHAIKLGRVAFRSPFLLGGVAARVGLRCDSCHPNGHANASFRIPGVSSAPGTVDVTGSVFSHARDDGIFNPVPIPSLVGVANRALFGSVVPMDDLSKFIDAVVVDEFDGDPPPATVAAGLLAYLGSLKPAACPSPGLNRLTWNAEAADLRENLEIVIGALDQNDFEGADFALRSLRAHLGRAYRRFPDSVVEREGLVELSRSLGSVRSGLSRASEDAGIRMKLESLADRLDEWVGKLSERTGESYYDPERLREALGRHRGKVN